jgi:hypothetical protein
MNNQSQSLFKADKKKYHSEYMKEWLKKKKVECECGCTVFPHALKHHQQSLKHKYLVTILKGQQEGAKGVEVEQ